MLDRRLDTMLGRYEPWGDVLRVMAYKKGYLMLRIGHQLRYYLVEILLIALHGLAIMR